MYPPINVVVRGLSAIFEWTVAKLDEQKFVRRRGVRDCFDHACASASQIMLVQVEVPIDSDYDHATSSSTGDSDASRVGTVTWCVFVVFAVMIVQMQDVLRDAVKHGLVSPGIVNSHARLDEGWRGDIVQYYVVAKGTLVWLCTLSRCGNFKLNR